MPQNLPLKHKICVICVKPKIDSDLLLYKQLNKSNLVVVLAKWPLNRCSLI